ncbi:TraR/DksA C4-type zinc finger protein [Salmonella enterica subsp. enterica]|nr:TraR/DksA C4-type zinc finger protein [Salmonella enterica subsp. enterica]
MRTCGGIPIPEARRKAVPGVRLCIARQQGERFGYNATFSGYNQRSRHSRSH